MILHDTAYCYFEQNLFKNEVQYRFISLLIKQCFVDVEYKSDVLSDNALITVCTIVPLFSQSLHIIATYYYTVCIRSNILIYINGTLISSSLYGRNALFTLDLCADLLINSISIAKCGRFVH